MKIRLVGAELFHTDERTDGLTDGQTDVTESIVAFRNFGNAPKKLDPDLCLKSVNSVHTFLLFLRSVLTLFLPLMLITPNRVLPHRLSGQKYDSVLLHVVSRAVLQILTTCISTQLSTL